MCLTSARANPEAAKKALTSGLLNHQLDPLHSQVWCQSAEWCSVWLHDHALSQYIGIGLWLYRANEGQCMHG